MNQTWWTVNKKYESERVYEWFKITFFVKRLEMTRWGGAFILQQSK